MEAKLQLRVQRYGWDAAAPVYQDEWRDNLVPAQTSLLQALALEPGQSVVETAAGSGLVTLPVARAVGEEGRVVATDLSAEMVKACAREAEAAGLGNVHCERQNAEELSFEDGSFERAVCSLGLMFCPNPDRALAEFRRVLRPSGRAAVAVWGERRNCGWAEIFPITDARVQSEVCPMFFGLGAPGALVAELERAGFTEIEEQRLHSPLRFASAERLLAAVIDGGAVALAAKRFSPEVRAAVEEEFLATVADYAVGQGYEIPSEFVIASGRA